MEICSLIIFQFEKIESLYSNLYENLLEILSSDQANRQLVDFDKVAFTDRAGNLLALRLMDKQQSANLLATIKKNMFKLADYLNDNKVPTRSSKVDFEVPRIFGSKSTAF